MADQCTSAFGHAQSPVAIKIVKELSLQTAVDISGGIDSKIVFRLTTAPQNLENYVFKGIGMPYVVQLWV